MPQSMGTGDPDRVGQRMAKEEKSLLAFGRTDHLRTFRLLPNNRKKAKKLAATTEEAVTAMRS